LGKGGEFRILSERDKEKRGKVGGFDPPSSFVKIIFEKARKKTW